MMHYLVENYGHISFSSLMHRCMVENHRYPLSFIDAWLRIMNIPFLSIINAQMHGSELWNPIFFFVHLCIDAWLRVLDNLSFTDAFSFWCEHAGQLFVCHRCRYSRALYWSDWRSPVQSEKVTKRLSSRTVTRCTLCFCPLFFHTGGFFGLWGSIDCRRVKKVRVYIIKP